LLDKSYLLFMSTKPT